MDAAPTAPPAASQTPRRWRRRLLWGAVSVFVHLAAAYVLFTGPRDLASYPARESSPYKLPWPAGQTWLCGQSNRGLVSHRGAGEFAFDFMMPEGSDVCAARGGVVTAVLVRHDGHGLNAPNNYVAVAHGDGTSGWYLHLRKDGSLVRVGERVEQGQRIGKSGHVGRSLAPHLHFQVRDDARRVTIPISFADVTEQAGVPRMGFHYTSGNKSP
jgi:murein DD-endopeptidase MepM/ murein hydrolase activator NlpD